MALPNGAARILVGVDGVFQDSNDDLVFFFGIGGGLSGSCNQKVADGVVPMPVETSFR